MRGFSHAVYISSSPAEDDLLLCLKWNIVGGTRTMQSRIIQLSSYWGCWTVEDVAPDDRNNQFYLDREEKAKNGVDLKSDGKLWFNSEWCVPGCLFDCQVSDEFPMWRGSDMCFPPTCYIIFFFLYTFFSSLGVKLLFACLNILSRKC